MAQSANALNEPSMDDILASIREIIEENTASQLLDEENGGVEPITDVTKVANVSFESQQTIAPTPEKGILVSQVTNEIEPEIQGAIDNDVTDGGLKAQIDESLKERLSVDEAMNALARRIGLSVENEDGNGRKPAGAAAQATQQSAGAQKQQQEDANTGMREEQTKADKQIISAVQNVVADEKFFEHAENVVDEVLRPVLRRWLEKNFQPLVERILREEVTKSLKTMR